MGAESVGAENIVGAFGPIGALVFVAFLIYKSLPAWSSSVTRNLRVSLDAAQKALDACQAARDVERDTYRRQLRESQRETRAQEVRANRYADQLRRAGITPYDEGEDGDDE